MNHETVEGALLQKVHELVAAVVEAGDIVVDATIGNGHDTLFLAQCVGVTGKVVGFDVQLGALESTRMRLLNAGIEESNFELHHQSHAQMTAYVSGGVSAVVFNLGYLPGADKSVITMVETTLAALRQAMDCLGLGGLLTVMCYPGHSGGDTEAVAVKQWMQDQDGKTAEVCHIQRKPAGERSPFLFVATKR